MPHEADSTGLTTLLWLICVYWNLVWFTQQLTSLGQAGNGETADPDTGEISPTMLEVLPSHFKCPQSGGSLPVENPRVWVYPEDEQ